MTVREPVGTQSMPARNASNTVSSPAVIVAGCEKTCSPVVPEKALTWR